MLPLVIAPFRIYKRHVESLLDGFDPLIDGPTLPSSFPDKSRFHFKYFIPFFLSTAVVFDCIRLIAANGFRLTPDLSNLFHRIVLVFWPNYWDQGDAIFLGAYIILPFTYFTLTRSRFVHRVNFLYRRNREKIALFTVAGLKLSRELSNKLWSFRMKTLAPMKGLKYSMIANMNLVFTCNFLYAFILKPDWSFRVVISLIISPFFFSYISYNITMGNYFWLTCRYIKIKQDHYLGKLGKMIGRVDQRARLTEKIWSHYLEAVRKTLGIVEEIKIFNAFFSVLISIIFLVYILEICYICFMLTVAKSNQDRLQMTPLTLFAILYFVFIFVVTGIASTLIANNVLIYKHMRQFHTRYQRHTAHFREHLRMNALENYSSYYQKGSFKLFNGYVINHRLFELLLSWIMFASLKLFGEKVVVAFMEN